MSIQNMKREQQGSALILVIIVTVLLSVVGIMFVMTMRMREMTTANVTDDRDLDTAVGAVTGQIQAVLRQDLFGTNLSAKIIDGAGVNEAYDSSTVDPWLASLEPDATTFRWHYVTDLTNTSGAAIPKNLVSAIVPDYPTGITAGRAADADGDGVADSMWIQLANLSTSRGKSVFAAVRIIDNCAMLNLNNAFCFYQDPTNTNSPFAKPWYVNLTAFSSNVLYGDDPVTAAIERYYTDGGRYLSEVNYYPFLRGNDLNFLFGWYNILVAKRIATVNGTGALTAPYPLPNNIHNNVLMKIENPGSAYSLFDIGDELEIRNRFTLTSKAASRFKRSDVANFTLDSGGGLYSGLTIPVGDSAAFNSWKIEMNPANFDPPPTGTGPNPGYYDRRHLCTFYSFDRTIRSGSYLLLDAALQTIPVVQRQTVEEIFRPIHNRPIDLRTITDPAKLDLVTNNPVCITANTLEARKNILHLLYAFRDYFYDDIMSGGTFPIPPPPQAMAMAAKQSAQIVANMIDYQDDATADGATASTQNPFYDVNYKSQRRQHPTFLTENPTFIDRSIIRQLILDVSTAAGNVIDIGQTASSPVGPFEFGLGLNDTATPPFETVYGYEQQPFISEVYCDNQGSGILGFAVELVNPYNTQIDLNGWNIKVGTQDNTINAAGIYLIPSGSGILPGRLTIYAGTVSLTGTGIAVSLPGFGMGTPSPMIGLGNILRLQRPDPANIGQFITVDSITENQRVFLCGTNPAGAPLDTSRKDTAWGFVNKLAYPTGTLPVTPTTPSLGSVNLGVASVTQKGCWLPVDNGNNPIDRLADFQKIIYIGNEDIGTDPNTITSLVAKAFDVTNGGKGEKSVRFDPTSFPSLSEYICTLSREEKGIPGRININTAPLHVIAAAIPPQLVMSAGDPTTAMTLAQDIVNYRNTNPFTKLIDLLKIPAMKKYVDAGAPDVGEPIKEDFEERDWIFNRLANIFTVRSDTFTAYILVRLGTDGPQRRMIAIFDRSNCWTKDDKPRLVALHPVPDPR